MPRLVLAVALVCSFPVHAEEDDASCPQMDFGVEAPVLSLDADQLTLNADQASLAEEGFSKLTGSVRVQQGDKVLIADQMDFNDSERRLLINAESVFRNADVSIRSKKAEYDLDTETGVFSDSEFTMPSRSARGRAARMELDREGHAQLDGVRYTTCAPRSHGWQLRASHIELDKEKGFGTARNARLKFLDVPIFYAPWFRFPIDDRRRTGLLFPTFGESDRTGIDLQQPLYINLAPNYDATLTPRYMSERGTQINTDLRWLLRDSTGRARYEHLSEDQETGEMRDYLTFNHQSRFNPRTGLELQYAGASDRQYFEDFGGRIDYSSLTHLERSARLTYQAPVAYRLQALVQDFQTLTQNIAQIDEPYRRLPQLLFEAETRKAFLDTRAGFRGEYVNFAREDSVQGQRVDLHPYLRMEQEGAAWFARSTLEYDYTSYQLSDAADGQDTGPTRSLPSFSAETGLRFDRITSNGELQLLEPRAFYLYTPYANQDDQPNFDSGEPDFEFTQLFAHNRFLGHDRISDANHVAIAASLRQLDPLSGVTRFNASIGQLFRLEAPRVTLPGGTAPDSGGTDFIASLDYRISRYWRSIAAAQWSPSDNEFNRTSLGLAYRGERRRLDLGYRYRQDTLDPADPQNLEQTDVILFTPLVQRWSAAARWRYSLADSQTLDTQAGLEYETCCWALRTSWRRYIATSGGEYSTGIYFQLELKGLTRIGTGFTGLLPSDSNFYPD
ncbi:MAG TPA: LPS assembly protein LptD [Solimonas sp.]|nr:LPS assembly protein LptD [Solimonas sp.]